MSDTANNPPEIRSLTEAERDALRSWSAASKYQSQALRKTAYKYERNEQLSSNLILFLIVLDFGFTLTALLGDSPSIIVQVGAMSGVVAGFIELLKMTFKWDSNAAKCREGAKQHHEYYTSLGLKLCRPEDLKGNVEKLISRAQVAYNALSARSDNIPPSIEAALQKLEDVLPESLYGLADERIRKFFSTQDATGGTVGVSNRSRIRAAASPHNQLSVQIAAGAQEMASPKK